MPEEPTNFVEGIYSNDESFKPEEEEIKSGCEDQPDLASDKHEGI